MSLRIRFKALKFSEDRSTCAAIQDLNSRFRGSILAGGGLNAGPIAATGDTCLPIWNTLVPLVSESSPLIDTSNL